MNKFDKLTDFVESSFDESKVGNSLESLIEELDGKNFSIFTLDRLEDDELTGEFYGSKPYSMLVKEEKDGVMHEKKIFRAECIIVNTSDEEYLRFHLNLKSVDAVQKDVSSKSPLAKTIRSLFKYLDLKWSESHNNLDKLYLQEIFDTIEGSVFTVTGKQAGVYNGSPYYFCEFLACEVEEDSVVEQMV
jgi:hypothetical protein